MNGWMKGKIVEHFLPFLTPLLTLLTVFILHVSLAGAVTAQVPAVPPPLMSVIFRQHPQITTFHLFCKCLWSHVIWFSLHCPSVDGSWWGLREPSLLFSWEPVPKQHLAMLRSQTHTHVHRHTHTGSVIQTATHMLDILYLTSSVYASHCRISSNHLSICSHSIKSHCSLLSAV